jgi:hypothetical protein
MARIFLYIAIVASLIVIAILTFTSSIDRMATLFIYVAFVGAAAIAVLIWRPENYIKPLDADKRGIAFIVAKERYGHALAEINDGHQVPNSRAD